jgi:hypothetical protein
MDSSLQGVIHYIHFNSGGLYNCGELLLERSISSQKSDPVAMLDCRWDTCYEAGWMADECFSVTFLRAAVRPSGLMIGCGPLNTGAVWSFVFQCWMSGKRRWVTLVERTYELRPLFELVEYLIDTPFVFRKFRFIYTGQVVPGLSSFSIAGFDINGRVFPDDDERTKENEVKDERWVEFDPWSIQECTDA